MPDQWVYRDDQPGRPPQRPPHPPTERVPWQPSRYRQTEHIGQLAPRLPAEPPATGAAPSFNAAPAQLRQPGPPADPWQASQQPPASQEPPRYSPSAPRYEPPRQPDRYARPLEYRPHQLPRKTGLTAFEQFWYILGNIPFAAMYFAKIPAKKAMSDFGLVEMTAAEKFWYVLMCFPFGTAYFLKIPVAKAISEMQRQR